MSAEWHFLVTLNERLRPLRDPVEIQQVVVQLVREHLQASRVHNAQIQGNEFAIRQSSESADAPPFPNRRPVAFFGQTILDACRRGEAVVVDDARTDARLADTDRAPLIASGMAAFIAVSLTKGDQWLATFCVHAATPRRWTRDQVAVVEVTSERLWGAGERARVEEALGRQAFLRQLNDTIRPLADPGGILHEACRLLGTNMHVNRVVFA
jgi:GAF domain-containing protein